MTGWTREVHEIHEAIQDRIAFRSAAVNARDPDSILTQRPLMSPPVHAPLLSYYQEPKPIQQAAQPAAPRPQKPPKKKGKKDRFTPAKSVCRDCGTGCTIPRWHHFRAARPRCQRCGGSLDYTGPY